MSETSPSKHRRDAIPTGLAVLCSVLLAAFVGGGMIIWNRLEQTSADNAALAAQVRSLGGKPVVEPGKPGSPGVPGPPGVQGVQGRQGPPGIAGRQGPIGITGQSPRCLLEPTRCVGPAGKNGTNGQPGTDGVNGADGKDGQPGAPGADGKPGADGSQGLQGVKGETGPAGPDTSTEKCTDAGGSLQQVTVQTSDPLVTAKILVCVL